MSLLQADSTDRRIGLFCPHSETRPEAMRQKVTSTIHLDGKGQEKAYCAQAFATKLTQKSMISAI